MHGRVLIVAGSDSGGGAGIQADVKAVTVLGGYAATAVTALTAQNTLGVFGVLPVEPAFVSQQMEVVLTDIGADAIKTGMLHSSAVIAAVASTLQRLAHNIPVVVDPVMVAKGGTPLLEDEAREALVQLLLPQAALVTPNLPEAELLSGVRIRSLDDMRRAADLLLASGASAVLLKGGHLPGNTVVDILRTVDGEAREFEHPRVETRSTHGTGCTLASAIATGIAEGLTLEAAVDAARRYVLQAIRTAPGLGGGHGPLNHAHPIHEMQARAERQDETLH
ncbi:MAG TPA: bifunctional hydroxymethylpyrimidine kinase/phosphomethylpyrimidine kinase [Polyangiaceae bacterium]|nr:bifunctional hydroxymethylpyrimidine kinase/phosphomethylpyrimidine kinase [Polyangiaceae bacterium]